MAKPPTTWKKFELKVCRFFNGSRRGPDFRKRNGEGGDNDCKHSDFSIEVKLYKRPSWEGVVQGSIDQATAAAEGDEIPFSVIKKNGDRWNRTVIVLRPDTFKNLLQKAGYDIQTYAAVSK